MLPRYWGELTTLKLVGVVVGCFVISWLYAKQTTKLIEIGIPISMLYLAWQASERVQKCWEWYLGCAAWDNYGPKCQQILKTILYIEVLFFVGLIWYFFYTLKTTLIALVALDPTILYPFMLVIVLRTPPDDDNCCYRCCSGCCFCCAGAAASAAGSMNKVSKGPGKVLEPILGSDAPRSDEELTA